MSRQDFLRNTRLASGWIPSQGPARISTLSLGFSAEFPNEILSALATLEFLHQEFEHFHKGYVNLW